MRKKDINHKIDTILAGLNVQQIEAVTSGDGPLLIVAGAGTGKTTVITRRLAYLIACGKVKPEEILALTFTDKAAAEMEERADVLVPYGCTEMQISTFHAFGDKVLREHALAVGLDPEFEVLTQPEQVIFIREHLFKFPLRYYRPLGDPTRFIEALVTVFSRARDEDISVEEYLAYAQELQKTAAGNKEDKVLAELCSQQKEVAESYAVYQQLKAEYSKVDFADQFYQTLQLFRNHPLILKEYQSRFKHILVDEFQDTNYAQFQLVKVLAEKHKNITVAADDDQSIYKFRGAAVSNILNFMTAYPSAKMISITKNYRSTQKILDSAYRLITFNNPDRLEVKKNIDKRLVALKQGELSPAHIHCDTISTEADRAASLIEEKVRSGGYKYQDFAILVRSNNGADPFLRALNMKGIPWRFSGNQGLYSRPEVRLAISFLRILSSLDDSISLYNLASSEIYQLDMMLLAKCMSICSRQNNRLFDIFKNLDKYFEPDEISIESLAVIEKFKIDIEKCLEFSRHETSGKVLYKFLSETGYLKRLAKEESLRADEKIQNLAKFFDIVRNFEKLTDNDRVSSFVKHLDMLIEAGDSPAVIEADLDIPAVNVLTVHKAKGLEFRVVFLVSLVSRRFPCDKRRDAIELPQELIKDILPSGDFHLQEERRLFYVGMTRAKEELYLTSSQDYGGAALRKVSRFVNEALGKAEEEVAAVKASAAEVIERSAPISRENGVNVSGTVPKDKVLSLSWRQVDDYFACPLKYKYIHILRVPVREHHTVVYGKLLHDCVNFYYKNRMNPAGVNLEKLLKYYRENWRSEGFLNKAHEEERFEDGLITMEKFFEREEKKDVLPAFLEKEFKVIIGGERVIGRFDRIDIIDDKVYIIDYKSSAVDNQKEADKRAKQSVQMEIYAFVYKLIYGRAPEKVKLYFLESGLIGEAEKSDDDLQEAVEKLKEVSSGIKKQHFEAAPKHNACNWCVYSQICPYTAYKGSA